MNFLLTKKFEARFNTASERTRIAKAFRNDPVTRKKLTKFMDAIEAMDWAKANKLLDSKWWAGRDKKQECPRLEFVGMPGFFNPEDPSLPVAGFSQWMTYADLAYWLGKKRTPGGGHYMVRPLQ